MPSSSFRWTQKSTHDHRLNAVDHAPETDLATISASPAGVSYDRHDLGFALLVRLTVSGANWHNVMVENPNPAGFEFIERDDLIELNGKPAWWSWWLNRREYHDGRAAIFQTYLDRRQAQYVYLLKAVNPGHSRANPARIQPMYQPQQLTATDVGVVEVI